MKKILITIISFLYVISSYCQSKALYLKSKEQIRFQTWDTIYAIKSYGDLVILKDKHGKKYECNLDVDGNESNNSIEISSGNYHIHGDHRNSSQCHSGIIIMDSMMKLFFNDNSKSRSNHFDHGSHMSHYSHYSAL